MRKYLLVLVAALVSSNCLTAIYNKTDDEPDETPYLPRIVWRSEDTVRVLSGQHLSTVRLQAEVNPDTNGVKHLEGLKVEWKLLAGGGSLTDSVSYTDLDGFSSIGWTVGVTGPQQVQALVVFDGADSSQIAYSAIIGRLILVSGNNQHLSADFPAPASLLVKYIDYTGAAVSGVSVRWSSDIPGLVVPFQTFTGADGISGTVPDFPSGIFGQAGYVTAQRYGNAADTIHFNFLIDHRLHLADGGNQQAPAGSLLPNPVEVDFRNPVNGEGGPPAQFRWEVISGGGSLRFATLDWTHAGPMKNYWTLGPTPGVQTIRIVPAGTQTGDTLLVSATATGEPVATGCGGTGMLHEPTAAPRTVPETWTAAGSPHIVRGLVQFGANANLTIQPGAVVCLEENGIIYLYSTLHAVGTQANPIRFTAADSTRPWGNILLAGQGSELSEISNARIEHGYSAVVAGSPVRIDSTIIRQSRNIAILIDNSATTNRVYHTTVDTVRNISNPAVLLNAPGTLFVGTVRGTVSAASVSINASDVTLQGCEIGAGTGYGVIIGAFTGTAISGCNLTGNGNLAVGSTGTITVNAPGNWWGNAAGPAIGGPNGISTGVDAGTPLSAPATIGYRPTW